VSADGRPVPGVLPRGRRYRVRHRTEYVYDEPVTASYGRAYLIPRDVPGQWIRATRIEVSPTPDLLTQAEDYFGNASAYLEVHSPHTQLVVTATSEVAVDRPAPDLAAIDGWTWEQARDGVLVQGGAGVDLVQAHGFLLPSPQVEPSARVAAYAATVFRSGRPVGEAVRDLVRAIHADFSYRPGVTSVSTSLAEVLQRRAGVCQDFAHLAVACLRGSGLPARYVSGYLETRPPSGRPRLQGADASHAWASVLLPELGWVDLDPTNDRLVDDDYVVTAWGRDYTDVPPLRGVIFTQSKKRTMEVAVDVVRLGPAGGDRQDG
jgi:transglutaminase-like putative cysteine protease